ncbi:MAG: hypothetical protein QM802_24490 [Agriterribacter sp.]
MECISQPEQISAFVGYFKGLPYKFYKKTMFGIFGLVISLIIIFIYSLIYAGLGLLIIYILSKITKVKWIKRVISFRLLTFISLGIFFGIVFLIYHFSYWRDKGFGDSFRIPIGNGYQVSNIDGISTYFEDSKSGGGRQAFLTNFTVDKGKLCANFQGFNSTDCQDCYIVFDTKLKKMYEFYSGEEYKLFATKNGLPFTESFKEFTENYNDYWTRNSKWYLP